MAGINDLNKNDLFGNVRVKEKPIRDKHTEPPFSVLDTKTGSWQNRKKMWGLLGIRSEIGRDVTIVQPTFRNREGVLEEAKQMERASIFDPALCEVLYNWFCPDGGRILDPFAGGSVRGIVANYIGKKYTGIDIRPEQIESNREQGLEILDHDNQPLWLCGDSNVVLDSLKTKNISSDGTYKSKRIKISVASMKQLFQPCLPDYIKNVCKGRCCEGSGGKIVVTVHDSEKERMEKIGAILEGNFIKDVSGCGKCTFKSDEGFCKIHEDKPFGCKASPFTLNQNNTLIIRNRYRLLKCYNTPDAVPAYVAHRWSFEQIFGREETERIIAEIKAGVEDVYAEIDEHKYNMLIDNDIAKHPERKFNPSVDGYDLVFSCPPYADLEVYSDMDGDISNMKYPDFLKTYKSIIKKSCNLLKPGGFAIFVVSEVRNPKSKSGRYYGFVPDTISAFQEAGMEYYNEAILLNAIGTAMMRVGNTFEKGNKKLVSVHQNILMFIKPEKKFNLDLF